MENYPLMALIIGYTCVGVFVATALAVVLDMFNLWHLAEDIRHKLYAALVFEVVVIGVGLFASLVRLDPQTAKAEITTKAQQQVVEEQVKPLEQKITQLQTPVFLQIADESQRPAAKRLTEKLTQQGFNVRGIENVGAKNSPSKSQVRFFSGNEQFPAYAQAISNAMKATGINDVDVAPSPNKAFGENVEVWLSPNVAPTLDGFTYVVAVNQDDVLKDAQVHLQEMLLDKKYANSYLLFRPGEGYRTVRLFETREEAEQFIPIAKKMNDTVANEPKQLNVWCPNARWNREGKFFACS